GRAGFPRSGNVCRPPTGSGAGRLLGRDPSRRSVSVPLSPFGGGEGRGEGVTSGILAPPHPARKARRPRPSEGGEVRTAGYRGGFRPSIVAHPDPDSRYRSGAYRVAYRPVASSTLTDCTRTPSCP